MCINPKVRLGLALELALQLALQLALALQFGLYTFSGLLKNEETMERDYT